MTPSLAMKLLIAVVLLIASGTASAVAQAKAKPVEKWECKDYVEPGKVLVTATVDSGRTSGTIAVAGVTYTTAFGVTGFDRRWDFGPKEHPAQYAFIIKPDGAGLYYDFSTGEHQERASMVLKCRQR